MAAPWFDPNEFTRWDNAISEGLSLIICLFGALVFFLVSRGVGRKWVLGVFYVFIAIGVLELLVGIYALCAGQPWEIWFGPFLSGALKSVILPPLAVLLRFLYRLTEGRRLEAGGLRKG